TTCRRAAYNRGRAPTLTAASLPTLNGVWAGSATDAWAIGASGDGTAAAAAHWDGASWNEDLTIPPAPVLLAIAGFAPGQFLAVGAGGTILAHDAAMGA